MVEQSSGLYYEVEDVDDTEDDIRKLSNIWIKSMKHQIQIGYISAKTVWDCFLGSFGDCGSVCILSVGGAVSSVTIRGHCGVTLRYEGWFEIISLSGSCTYTSGNGDPHYKNGMLSISLAKPVGTLFGGDFESSLIASMPMQLVIGTFKKNVGSPNVPNVPGNPDSVSACLKVPQFMEGETSYPSPTASTNGGAYNASPAATNGVPNVKLNPIN